MCVNSPYGRELGRLAGAPLQIICFLCQSLPGAILPLLQPNAPHIAVVLEQGAADVGYIGEQQNVTENVWGIFLFRPFRCGI